MTIREFLNFYPELGLNNLTFSTINDPTINDPISLLNNIELTNGSGRIGFNNISFPFNLTCLNDNIFEHMIMFTRLQDTELLHTIQNIVDLINRNNRIDDFLS